MPIKGLTDKDSTETPTRGLALLGRLYKGAPKPESGNKPGEELKYFRVEFAQDTNAQKAFAQDVLIPAWEKLYSAQPENIPGVFLMADNIDMIFPTWNEEYTASGLVRRCDGESQIAHRGPDNLMHNNPISCARGTEHTCDCKQHGSLKFVLPELMAETGVVGYFVLSTHSVNDIVFIHGSLTYIKRWVGTLQNVPLILSREPREFQIAYPDKQGQMQQRKSTKYLALLKIDPVFVRSTISKLITANQPQLLSAGDGTAPDAPDTLDTDAESTSVDNPADEHWSTDPEKANYWKTWLAKKPAWDIDRFPGKLTEYPTVREAALAVETFFTRESENEPDPSDETTSESYDEAKDRVGRSIEHETPPEKPAEQSGLIKGLEWVDLGRLCDGLGVSESEVLEIMGVESWAELGGSLDEVREKVIALMLEHNASVVVKQCQYTKLPKAHMTFDTVLGTMYWWRGRHELEVALAQFEITVEGFADWKEGKHELPVKMLATWERAKTGQLVIQGFALP